MSMKKAPTFLETFPNHAFRFIDQTGEGRPPVSDSGFREDLNNAGYEAYFTVNGFLNHRGATKTNLTNLNAFFIDIDGRKDAEEIENIKKMLMPTYIVETKRGYHVYWLLDEPIYKDECTPEQWNQAVLQWELIEASIVEKLNGDPVVKDVSRILRVPNSLYWKGTGNAHTMHDGLKSAYKIKGIHKNMSARYSFAQVEEVFPRKEIKEQEDENVVEFWKKADIEYPLETRPSFKSITSGVTDDFVMQYGRNNVLTVAVSLMKQAGWSLDKAKKHIHATGWHGLETESGGYEEIQNTIESVYSKGYVYRKNNPVIQFYTTKEERDAFVQACVRVSNNEKLHDIEFLSVPTGKQKIPVVTLCTENICRALRYHPYFKDRVRFDAFKNVIEVRRENNDEWQAWEDIDEVQFQNDIAALFEPFQRVYKNMVFDAVMLIAHENKIDSAKDYIEGMSWDGVARLDRWLTETYGAPEDEYHRAVGANWIKGLVKRIVEPGCKFDYVLVIEGPQGTKKSTSFAIIGKNWHLETAMNTENKDFFMQFQGKAIIEFSEGEVLSRTEVKRLKAIITMQVDRFRPPYGRVSKDFPRRCVFAMTTNQEEYLKDETGNRRWLPVKLELPEVNIDWLEENRDQLLAEAYHRVFALKETLHEFPEEATKAMQESRRIHDPNEDLIIDWYYEKLKPEERRYGITTYQVFKDALHGGFAGKAMMKHEEMAITGVLKDVIKLFKKRTLQGGLRAVRWFQESDLVDGEPPTEGVVSPLTFDNFGNKRDL